MGILRKIGSNIIAVMIVGLVLFSCGTFNAAIGEEEKSPFQDVSDLLLPFTRGGLENGGGGVSEGVGGAAWLDYNNDGNLDLFVTNGVGHANVLFHNNGDGTFTEVAGEAGVDDVDGHSGVVAADIDNDGCTDLFLTGEGAGLGMADGNKEESLVKLYINNCNDDNNNNNDDDDDDDDDNNIFTFTDITKESGIPEFVHGVSAAFGDINNDGYLDLFVARPNLFDGKKDLKNGVFLNKGNGTFDDISDTALTGVSLGACAVSFSDYNKDGWIDIFVANCADLDLTKLPDLMPISAPFQLLHNNGDLTFTDVAPDVGLDYFGFWMAVTIADINGDLDLDLFATNSGVPSETVGFPGSPHILYKNNGEDIFTNEAEVAGLADETLEFGWGASFLDVDNDGDEDLFYAGSFPPFGVFGPGLGSPGRLFLNDGSGVFTKAGAFGQENKYTSGVAVGDFDNNGFPDVVVVATGFKLILPNGQLQVSGQPLLLKNNGNGNNWLTVRLVGEKSNRGGVGARVVVSTKEKKQVKEVYAGSSFLSTNSPWLTFGLGKYNQADIRVTWPSGLVEDFDHVRKNQTVTLVEETGKEVESE